ncbi:hypothetical protein Despr_2523 [Desulfobulbus propionicus DSM 2032]|uniref:Uncharacterized protein n=1 Tax=Desulfobulbus propionicus (strain ATCC 33891 / DSM 2032 / VKM B-1956 / 1pr3) TaxID=577650 RepID=A0A7U4DPY8_DESPD|nr:hypothetical protein [Desulfobulbus propionicus]ADW18661.1 hypothetical protein Despr_2523 [Desulfobulbus propionicus DSM 2032]
MNKLHNIWAAVCLVMSLAAFAAGHWSATRKMDHRPHPVPAVETGTRTSAAPPGTTGLPPREEASSELTAAPSFSASPPAADNVPPEQLPLTLPQPPEDMGALQRQELEHLKKMVAESLRTSGASEEEIKRQLAEQFPPSPEAETAASRQALETATEVSPEQVAKEFAESLRAAGASDEEINQALKGLSPSAPEERGK